MGPRVWYGRILGYWYGGSSARRQRLVYRRGKAGNLVTRLYLVEAISSEQNGKRFPIDYNVKF